MMMKRFVTQLSRKDSPSTPISSNQHHPQQHETEDFELEKMEAGREDHSDPDEEMKEKEQKALKEEVQSQQNKPEEQEQRQVESEGTKRNERDRVDVDSDNDSYEYTDSTPAFYRHSFAASWILSDQLNYRFEFKESSLRERYRLFKIASSSPLLTAIIAVLVFFSFITYWTLVLRNYHSIYPILLAIFSFFFAIVLFWLLIIGRFTISIAAQQTEYCSYFQILETIIMFGIIITLGLIHVMRNIRICDSLNYADIWACTPTAACGSIPGDLSMLLLFSPFIFSTIFPFISFTALVIGLDIGIAFVIFGIVYHHSFVSWSWFAVTFILSHYALFLYRLQHMEIFLYTSKFYEIRRQQAIAQKRLAQKLKEEMKNLIACVTHDLKSPLSAFIHGFDGLKDSLGECMNHLTSVKDKVDYPSILHSVGFMSNAIYSLMSSYQILIMTINRFTDYTKLSHGLLLVPTYETIHLVDALKAPISCVKDLQSRIDVELELIDKNLSEFIMTDRQWLQDNVLCLVSNAVKYSIEGKVKVRVFLTSSPSPGTLNTCLDQDRLELIQRQSNDLKKNILQDNEMIRIEVEDTGLGIQGLDGDELEDTKQIFQEPDFTKRRTLGGAGLGLHCLSKRIEALHGEFGASNLQHPKLGTLFWFTIPYKPILGVPPRSSYSSMRSHGDKATSGIIETLGGEIMKEYRKGAVSSILSVSPSGSHNASRDEMHYDEKYKKLHSIPSFTIAVAGNQKEESQKNELDAKETTIPLLFPAANSSQAGSDSPKRRQRILVVDDSMPIVKMLKLMLEKNGYEVVTAANGFEAAEIFRKAADDPIKPTDGPIFDGILMDLQMPVMDGIEAISKIREMEKDDRRRAHDLRQLIVAMSASSDEETMKAAYQAGGDEFLAKPFNLLSFQKIMQDCQNQSDETKEFKKQLRFSSNIPNNFEK